MTVQEHINQAKLDAERIYTDEDCKSYYLICYMLYNCSWLQDRDIERYLNKGQSVVNYWRKVINAYVGDPKDIHFKGSAFHYIYQL